jgi:PDZ domain-containing secreted protein
MKKSKPKSEKPELEKAAVLKIGVSIQSFMQKALDARTGTDLDIEALKEIYEEFENYMDVLLKKKTVINYQINFNRKNDTDLEVAICFQKTKDKEWVQVGFELKTEAL